MLALLNPTGFVSSSGYIAIFILSVLQSCCVPTSSELTLGFAGVLAAEGKLNLPGAIVAGVLGELVGAYIAWFIGRTGGRAFVDRFGRYLLLSHNDLDRAEAWYQRHGRWGVFGSRLLPVIRNFVALPAGVAEVPLARFGVLTFFGSLLWDAAMALIGYGVGGSWQKVMHGFSDAGYLLGVLAVLALAAVIFHRYRSYKAATSGAPRGRHVAGRHLAGTATATDTGTGDPDGTSTVIARAVAGQPAPTRHRQPRHVVVRGPATGLGGGEPAAEAPPAAEASPAD